VKVDNSFFQVDESRIVVICEKKDEVIEVVTALWVVGRRLKRLGFTRI